MGSVVLSLDAELAWGFHDCEPPPESRVEEARESWLRLLELFDEFRVPATWAVVGHLFLDSCDGEHTDHPTADGWFGRDPGTWEGRDEVWYGSKLIDAIEAAAADHDVGVRTFSGVDMSRAAREVAAAEVRESVELVEERGLSAESFTFPDDRVAHRDVLAAYGVRSYRGVRPQRWYETGLVGAVVERLGWPTGTVSPTLVEPEEDDYGLVNLPASMSLSGSEGRTRDAVARLTEDPVVEAARQGIDRAATEDGVFHLWFRPGDLTDDRDFDLIETVLEHLAGVRDRTGLPVETMADVAADVKDDEPLPREPIGPR
jgi:peptidoglycan/xylan/chitin deacetylase (PgdA/CDA1 family)